jgi:hypothetical protein
MHVVWEHFFRLVVAVAKGDSDAFIPERLEALAKHNLLVPVDDVRLIVEVAQRSLQQSDALRAPLADEHAGRVDLDWPIEKRRAQVTASYEIIVESRDELARLLSRQSFMAVKRYIAASVVPGMTLDVNLTQR